MEKKDYDKESERKDEIFSNAVRAGKRTYFFDVKATRGDDYYLTVTESKKKFSEDGKFHFEKHKLFLYKEDFEKFAGGLKEAIDFIQEKKGVYQGYQPEEAVAETTEKSEYSTSVDFEDLN
jgi:hypothetical protein